MNFQFHLPSLFLIKIGFFGSIYSFFFQTEEFNAEPISVLHYKNREEQSKVFRQSTLIYPIILQELPMEKTPL